MISNSSIDDTLTEELLKNTNWQFAILPTGKVAQQPCFEFTTRPNISPIFDGPDTNVTMVSQSLWTSSLIESSVNSVQYDDPTKRTLAKNWNLLVRSPQITPDHYTTSNHTTLHMIHLQTRALVNISRIQGPTKNFKDALEDAISGWPDKPFENWDNGCRLQADEVWKKLCRVWNTFGFMWPRKIRLGRKHEESVSYQCAPGTRRSELNKAKDVAQHGLSEQLGRSGTDTHFNSEDTMTANFQPIEWNEEEIKLWTIITREELQPVYELLPDEDLKSRIDFILKTSLPTIPVHRPFKLRNSFTGRYLCWQANSTHGKKGYATENSDILLGTLPQEAIHPPNSQCLWSFSWSGYPTTASHALSRSDLHGSPDSYESMEIRSGKEVYLHPSCRTPILSKQELVESQSMFLSKLNGRLVGGIKLFDSDYRRPLRTNPVSGSVISLKDPGQEPRWTVELPGLGYSMDNDDSTDEHLNIDILIGRSRQILHGDAIYLRNIMYLCSASAAPPIPRPQLRRRSLFRAQSVGRNGYKMKRNTAYDLPLPPINYVDVSIASTELQPIVGKENIAIQNPAEKSWFIELATDVDIQTHPDYQPWPEPLVHPRPADRMTIKRSSYCSGLSDTNSIKVNYHMSSSHTPSMLRRTRSLSSVPGTVTSHEWSISESYTDSDLMESISIVSNHRTPTIRSVAQSSLHSNEVDWNQEKKKAKELIKVYTDHPAQSSTKIRGRKSKLRKALSWDTVKKIFKGSTLIFFKSPSPRKKNTQVEIH